jgi:hypothetical protein
MGHTAAQLHVQSRQSPLGTWKLRSVLHEQVRTRLPTRRLPLNSIQRSLHVLHPRTSLAYPSLGAFVVRRSLPADHHAGDSFTLAWPILTRERPSQKAYHIAQEPRPHRSFQRRTPHILHKWRRHVPSALGVCEPASLMGAHLSRGYDPPD